MSENGIEIKPIIHMETGFESLSDKELNEKLKGCSGYLIEILRRLWKDRLKRNNQ